MRRDDWPERLAEYFARTARLPFAWGSQDCVCWACGAIQEMTGNDPAAPFRGTYTDRDGALRVMQELGGGDFRSAVESVCVQNGYEAKAPALAQRGDIVLCPSGRAVWPLALGVCAGADIVLTGKNGLVRVPLRRGLCAWSID